MKQACTHCSAEFEITKDDLAFYEKVSPEFGGKKYLIPPPTLCPECRMQRRLIWRNERKLYHRKCDLTGKQIISLYSADKLHKVYNHADWYSDKWDALRYGREIDFSQPFFEQFKELMLEVPMLSINLQAGNENCEFTNLTTRNRNCYLIFAANDNEDCYYCTYLHRSRNSLDCFFIFDCESCYECVDCYSCNRLFHSQYGQNCSDSLLLYDCRNCSHCFGCVSLVSQQYSLFNEPCSPEDFQRAVSQALSDPHAFADAKARFETLKLSLPHRHMAGISNEDVSGDHISFSKHVHYSYDITYCEDCKFCTWLHRAKECYDCYAWGIPGELGYENHLCGNTFYNVRFSESCWNNVSDLLYCRYCVNGCKHLFGCIGLQKREYCILNKQYSKEEYEKLVPQIIEHMRKTPLRLPDGSFAGQEWGEFPPATVSPFAYNETIAQEYFPLTKDEVLKRGWQWREEGAEEKNYLGPVVDVPESILGVTDDITKQILACAATGKPYKIIPQELKFYREMGLPIPRRCPEQRHKERMALRNPRKLWTRACAKCSKKIETTYAPEKPEIVYCEECYLKTMY